MVTSGNSPLHLATIATTNITESTRFTGWMSEPNGRGTTGLLWSCLSTILLCTWTVVHLDVPSDYHHSVSYTFLHRLQWMFGAIFAPEIVLLRAVIEYRAAKLVFHKIQPLSPRICQWSMTHAFFCNSRGFALKRTEGNVQLRGEQTIQMLEERHLPLEDFPSKNEILERAKADSLAKGVTCLQALWLAAQVIGRAAQHLPMTTLEVTTMSFVACMLLSYLCWWSKAQNVEYPIPIKMPPSRRYSEILWRVTDDLSIRGNRYTSAWMHAFSKEHDSWTDVIFVLICLLVGGIHCAAWNFIFPSYSERLLWRIASIASSVLPMCLFFIISIVVENPTRGCPDLEAVLNGLFMLLYFVVRVFLIIEVFLSLRSVPIGVYQEIHWLSFVPHF
jgi:hypothetical protein